MGIWRWLNDVHIAPDAPPLTEDRQIHYDQSWAYRENQRNLIFTVLLTAALVMVVSRCKYLVRGGAGLAIALIANSLGGIWDQWLIDRAAGLPRGAIRTNLGKVLNVLLFLIVLGGVALLAAVLSRGEL
jgi:hypothetical protein